MLTVSGCGTRAVPEPVAPAVATVSARGPSSGFRSTLLFEGDPAAQQPADGVIPYDLNSALFSDYAEKYRFIKLPPGTHANYSADQVFEFPVGTVIAKTFAFPRDARDPSQGRRLIETRILKHEPDGWVGLPYIWNNEQTDATLDVAGDTVDVSWIHTDGRTRTDNYIIPNANQCKGCHKAGEIMRPIGPKARNLNRDFAYSRGNRKSACHTGAAAVRSPALPDAAAAPRLAVWDDPKSGTLDARARAWLEINCAHCHSPEGPAATRGSTCWPRNATRLPSASTSRRSPPASARADWRSTSSRPARQIDPGLSDRLDPSGHHDARTGQAARARRRGGIDPRVDRAR